MSTEEMESDAYPPLPPTPRHKTADALAEIIRGMKLANTSEDGVVVRDPNGKFYAVRFSIATLLSGEVRVYSPGYFRVFWVAHSDRLGVIQKDSRLFGSLEEVAAFIDFAFLQHNWTLAMAVPTYQYIRGPRQPKPVEPEQPGQLFPDMSDDFFCGGRDKEVDGVPF